MPIQVSSNLLPKNGAKWPVVEDIYLKGGMRVVADAAARDALYTDTIARLGLKSGMLLVTASDNKLWQYRGPGLWVQIAIPTTYAFDQLTPSDTWTVSHNLNTKHFTYTVFDSNGFQILPSECHIYDLNNLTLYFAAPISGSATFVFV